MPGRNILAYVLLIASLLTVFVYVSPTVVTRPTSLAPSGIADPSLSGAVNRLNHVFREHWKAEGLAVAPVADRLTIARRLALAMAGTIPSLEDQQLLQRFDSDDVAIAWWCERLLDDRRYADYFAERLARVLVGVDDGPFLIYRRRRFVSWLSDQLSARTPYDDLARQLITADGLWTDSPAVNFLTVTSSDDNDGRPDPIRLAGRTSRAFLGVRLDCMQCHDDNLAGEWLQSDFHQLAAFYCSPTPTLIGIVDQPRDYTYQYLGADAEQTILPRVPFNEDLLPADVPDDDTMARSRLATWVTHPDNRPFARAIVNRMWGLAFGRPLVTPVDQIPLSGPYPPGLEELADDLTRHGFDLPRLWRILARSEPFWRASWAPFTIESRHEAAGAVFPLTRLRPEQIAGAILQSSRLTTVDAQSHILVRLAQSNQLSQFTQRYGDTGEDELGSHGGTIPQRLLMMNGELVKNRTKDNFVANAATRIAALAPSQTNAIQFAYQTVLVRPPTDGELAYFEGRFSRDHQHSLTQQIEDLCWVLMNSTEFSWNH